MRIGYAILLENEAHNFARKVEIELNEKLGLKGGLIQSPHITFKNPFEVASLEPHIAYLDRLAQHIEPFDITLNGFGYFDNPDNKVIYIDVAENDQLKQLHYEVLNDLKTQGIEPTDFEGENIKFHSTVALDDVIDKYEEAKALVAQYNPQFTFKAQTLGLFYYTGNAWVIAKRIPLTGQDK